MRYIIDRLMHFTLLAAVTPAAFGTTWYVNGVRGNNANNCLSAATACKTISQAVLLAGPADTINVAAATYKETLSISKNLTVLGSGAAGTSIDGGGAATVVTVPSSTSVILSLVTIRSGYAREGGGINNSGTLTIVNCVITSNQTSVSNGYALGGGIYNAAGGVLTINQSTISGNGASAFGLSEYAYGGGVANNGGSVTISNTTISGNSASLGSRGNVQGRAYGGGVANLLGTMTINNSTLTGNNAIGALYTAYAYGGGISNGGTLTVSNSTISGNSSGPLTLGHGGGISGSATIQNSIVSNNSGGNCSGTMTSKGYNLSSDSTCNFNDTGDMKNVDPALGPLQNNGGPTQTMALLPGSAAIDGGNPNGCTDNAGHLLKTDQRGEPRPDSEDTSGCDIGAYESQTD